MLNSSKRKVGTLSVPTRFVNSEQQIPRFHGDLFGSPDIRIPTFGVGTKSVPTLRELKRVVRILR